MSFREILEQVREGRATPEQEAEVRAEIEKHEVISDYLAERFDEQFSAPVQAQASPEVRRIARRINLRLLCGGLLSVLALVLAAALAVLFCDVRYFNPNEGIAPVYGGDGQFFIDMAAFTELHSPGYTTNYAEATRDGPGSYDLRIRQSDLFSGNELSTSERLVRGRVLGSGERTSNGYWRFPIGNAFGYRQGIIVWIDENGVEHRESDPEQLEGTRKALAELPSSSRAAVYLTFDRDLTLAQFAAIRETYLTSAPDLYFAYAAVVTGDGYMPNVLGFEPSGVGLVLENAPEEEYPCFELAHSRPEGIAEQAEAWETHFRSLLRYPADRPEFLETFANVNGISARAYREALDYLDQNGVRIYGALVHGGVQDILRLLGREEIGDFHVEDVKLSILSR